jgi:hypothetical protein
VPGLIGPPASNARTRWVCVGQRLLEDCGDAIGGDHIKPHARTDYDSSGLSILLAALRGDKDFNFAGDIQIVGSTL